MSGNLVCTASVMGHRSQASLKRCPVHRAGIKLPPATAAPTGADTAERARVAVRLDSSSNALTALASDKDKSVRAGVARNPSSPPAVLAALARDKAQAVRNAASHNKATPAAALEALTLRKASPEQWGALSNPSMAPEVLERMAASNTDSGTLCRIASNTSTPPAVLARLAKSAPDDVGHYVARNPAAPSETLAALSHHKWSHIRVQARTVADTRICAALAIQDQNIGALDVLRDQAWWEMTADSPAVTLARALFPNS